MREQAVVDEADAQRGHGPPYPTQPLLAAWLLFPLALLAVTGGLGLLADRAAGGRVPGALIPGVGLAVLVVVSQLLTRWDSTGPATTPVAVVLAVLGLVAGRRRLRGARPDRWALGAALVVFLLYAAPYLALGFPSFGGYTVLGDSSVHFALADRLLSHGLNWSDLPLSSYSGALRRYLGTAYPTGADTALGALRPLAGTDLAWVYQPFLAAVMALAALALHELLRPIRQAPLRASWAVIAAAPALTYAFANQGAIKELATIWVLATLAALVPGAVAGEGTARRLVPITLTLAAGLGIVSVSLAPFAAPLLLGALVALALRRKRDGARRTTIEAVAVAVAAAVLALPVLTQLGRFLHVSGTVLTAKTELGNLPHALPVREGLGIWPALDFRAGLGGSTAVLAAVGQVLVVLAAVGGLVWAVRRRALPALLFAAALAVGVLLTFRTGSPWAQGKALCLAAPGALLLAGLGTGWLSSTRGRVLGWALTVLIGAGVIWSDALGYAGGVFAPHDRFAELAQIGDRFAGRGPVLDTEVEEFAKHFLRQTAPTDVGDPSQDVPLVAAPGHSIVPGFPPDLDDLSLPFVQGFSLIVQRRGPYHSRPPADWHRVFAGRFYDVWRHGRGPLVLRHLALGQPPRDPTGTPRCPDVFSLAREALQLRGVLAAAPRGPVLRFDPGRTAPIEWLPDFRDALVRDPSTGGVAPGRLRIPRTGRWTVWLEGSVGRRTSVTIDGRPVGSLEDAISGRQETFALGTVRLRAGVHRIAVVRAAQDLGPGHSGRRMSGPVTLTPAPDRVRSLRTVGPYGYRALCGHRWDWIEIVRSRRGD